ncbi:hypothetical protein ACC808_37285, partial [Rhizobium ruizarguesonis]
EDLRKRFGSAAGGDMEDPHFRAVAASVFKDGDSRKLPFADPATFLDRRSCRDNRPACGIPAGLFHSAADLAADAHTHPRL